MKRRLPNWMVGETFSQSEKHTNKCAVQPLFATDDTVPPADPVSLSESPDNRQQIRILRPSQINSIVLNIAEDVSAISNGTSIAVSNTSESDLAIQANEQEGNSTNQEEDIKMEADLALLEQLESNIHESERDRTADQRVELNTDTTSAGPSVLPDVVPHIPAQPEIKSEPSTQSAPESTPPKVKVETPGTMPVSTVQTAASSTTNTAGRVSCNYGVKCFRRNPQHRNDMAHPGDPDYRRPEFPVPPPGTPACPFGASCYRRNPQHFVQLHHPPASIYNPNTVPANYGVTSPMQAAFPVQPAVPQAPQQFGKGKRKRTPVVINSDDDDDDDDEEDDPFFDDNGSSDDFEPDED